MAGTLSISDITNGRVIQRSSRNGSTAISVGGTFTGDTPTSLEARVMKGGLEVVTWSLTSGFTISGSTVTGQLAGIPQGDGYNLEIRTKSGGTIIATSVGASVWGIGRIIPVLGSLILDRWFSDATTETAPNLARKYSSGNWGLITGAGAIAFAAAAISDEPNVPIGLLDFTASGSTLAQWASKGSNYNSALSAINSLGAEAVIVSLGSEDARAEAIASQAAFQTSYRTFITNLRTDANNSGLKIGLLGQPRAPLEPASSNAQWDMARNGTQTVATDINNFLAAITVDLPLVDNLNLTSGVQGGTAISARRTARAVNVAVNGATSNYRGPVAQSMTYNSVTGWATITFSRTGGSSLVGRTGQTNLTGFSFRASSGSVTPTTNPFVSGTNTVSARLPTGLTSVAVDILAGINPDTSNNLMDNDPLAYGITTGGSVTLGALGGNLSVAENSATGVVVGTPTGFTAGSSKSLSDNAGGRFAINSSTGQITVAGAIDYEAFTSHNVTVVETLAGASNSPRSTTLSIAVTDIVEGGGTAPGMVVTSDMATDHDDLAMLGVMVGLHRANACNVLAVCSDCRVPDSPAAIRKLLDYSNLNNIPVGAFKGNTGQTGSPWTGAVANFGAISDLQIADFPDAVQVMRQAIINAPTNNNIIAIMGSASVTAGFLQTAGGADDPRTGVQLCQDKVSRIVMQGGSFSSNPTSSTYNIGNDKAAAQYMYANMPVPFWIGSGAETGQVSCGPELSDDATLNIYRAGFNAGTDPVNAQGKRVAYDPVSLHAGVVGFGTGLYQAIRGTQTINASDTGTTWVASPTGPHYNIDIVTSTATVGTTLDQLIATAYTAPYVVAAPTGLTTTEVTGNTMTLSFATVTGAMWYEYQLNGGAWVKLPKTNKIEGLSTGTAYAVKVRGMRVGGAAGTGTASATINRTTTATAAPSVAKMFMDGAQGVWIDVDPAYCYKDLAGTQPAAVGDAVLYVTDRSGGGHHMVAVSANDGYILRLTAGKYRLDNDTGTKVGYTFLGNTDFAQVAFVGRWQSKSQANWQTPIMKPHALGSHSSPFQRWGLAHLNAGQPSIKTNGVAITVPTVTTQYTANVTFALDAQTAIVRQNGTQVGDGTDVATQSYPNSNVPLRMGSNGGGSEVFNGYFEGLVLINRSFTTDEFTLATADVEQA